jgi:hypothetical protein
MAAIICLSSATTQAQGMVYGVAGPSGISGFFRSALDALHAAGGGELLVAGRAGVAGELGIVATTSSALLVFSTNGVFHVQPLSARGPALFVTAGYTRMSSGDGSFNAWNVGAGIDLWTRDHLGLRVEFRDHVRPDARGVVQYWTVRAGVTFR